MLGIVMALVLVGAAIVGAALIVARALTRTAGDRAALALVDTFAPIVPAAREDPRILLAWYPIARTARTLFPREFARLDAARGAPFPFARGDAEAAHARCTADWLAWERRHDAEYKLKASALEQEIARGAEAGTSIGRARLDAIEREKLERYQQRYEDYVRTAKALQALLDP